jgi:putative transposase
LNITQSMSRKGNCWDNAPMESFFGHFKDEVDYKECNSFIELKQMVDSYIEEYNNHRYQWGLKKMTPVQYRGHLLAA